MLNPAKKDNSDNIPNNECDSESRRTAHNNLNSLAKVCELWFEDGNTVLQAGLCFFRLHGSFLSARSVVFRDLFSSPNTQFPDFQRDFHVRVSGCLLIKITDTAEDAKIFLMAIYHSGYFERPPAQTPLDVILAVLRLSVKYKVDYLRKRALAHLSSGYPQHLGHWDNRFANATFSVLCDRHPLGNTLGRSLAVLETCLKVEATWLLPAVMYECCSYDLGTILHHPLWTQSISVREKNLMLIGYMKQIEATRGQVLKFLITAPLERCQRPGICAELRRSCAESTLSWIANDPLGIWDEDSWIHLDDMCGLCLAVYKTMHREARELFWNNLPDVFDLPKWDVLLDARDVALGMIGPGSFEY